MYNKAKKLTSGIAGLVSLICGGLGAFLAIVSLVLMVVTNYYVAAEAYWLLGFLIKVGAGLIIASMGIKGMSDPIRVEIGEEDGKKLFKWVYVSKLINFALIILSVAMLILCYHSADGMFGYIDEGGNFGEVIYNLLNFAQIAMIALYVAVIALNAVTLLISDNTTHTEDEYADEEIADEFESEV